MTTIALPTPARIRPIAEPAMTCSCGSEMTIAPNRHFGTGLAVHRFIALCDTCDAVAFVPEPEQAGLLRRITGFVLRLVHPRHA